MKWASVPSAYRNCTLRASVRTARNFSPARKVLSITLPSAARRSFVRTNAPPLPGLTCWNSTILKIVPSTSMWLPFLNWLVEIVETSPLQDFPDVVAEPAPAEASATDVPPTERRPRQLGSAGENEQPVPS